MKRQKRFEALEKRPIHLDGFVKEWPEEGFVAMMGPNDPKPSIKIENGKVTEMDQKPAKDFDLIDLYIAKYGIKLENAEKVMAMDSTKIANMLCDPNVGRDDIIALTTAMTPAKAEEVISKLNFAEMIMATQKMRPRRTPATQCHVTNIRDNPVQIAADAADAALRGFPEQETTTAVARYAPLNAISLLVGAQTGRPGVISQCSVEEAAELNLGMRGFTGYAETISVYGTDKVFTDGDDTPWSKGFLASCYASRGLKMRFTSGSGSEVMMGYTEGKSMLYLESRCIFITKASGVQGLQNGGVSCIGIPGSVPGGIRSVLGENLLCMMLDLECASANDQAFSHSDMRRTERLLGQFIAGTDYISSGYSSTPNYDNTFAGSNTDGLDYDDYYVMERDLAINGGIHPVTEDAIIKVRNKAAKALQAVFEDLGLPKITDEEVEAATYANTSKDMPDRNMVEDMKAAQDLMDRGITAVDVVKALYNHGFKDVAQAVLDLQKQKVCGDFLQTSAIFDENWNVISAVNDANDYRGPGTGYRLEEDTDEWERIKNIPFAIDPQHMQL
ncbi:propanediol dehydratase, large subunit [Levilactobacillus namurensis DSM 19117]|uniref:Propanediol dehydratase, large subunit n=2 Tax=Levilactobacillus namurensis TaxID=380393 RepID=A0A0R1K0Y4_9LACO|nr:propanediol/glycerol family dehydratase large subunit [Levilactobacillus namurensis]PTM23878.1 propanediol dehydratase large subunit PduC [Lactobacillus sp. PFC-70]KRK77135.1 propanediol dehydratase, large subunit [Levilactobacillus namurensis DSM 19117]MDT7014323.1 propanediol/glycerol family dehydratase large subunit [Levilactobacillus namurensis]GEO73343.1 propanediol dehydratase large subunit [Levilactobacillus namurensis]HJE44797.1 propanediol/glycerol family dehydratase large subunit 